MEVLLDLGEIAKACHRESSSASAAPPQANPMGRNTTSACIS
jgi:hypothetical protein